MELVYRTTPHIQTQYPYLFTPTITFDEIHKQFGELKNGEINTSLFNVVGRITKIREYGKKLIFYDLFNPEYEIQRIQLMINLKYYKGTIPMQEIKDNINRWDVIGASGYPHRSNTGELSVLLENLILLAPCLQPMIELNELTNTDIRYSNRVLDFITNPKNRDIFITRNKIIKFIRGFLDQRNFLEVETPILHGIIGGANAKPFNTYINALHKEMHMRVAPELYLKKLICSGFERVYEIGHQFRNEDIDQFHHPEFTSCEFYMAYADYNILMKFTEELFSALVKDIVGNYKVMYQGQEIDFTPPFKKIDIMPTLQEIMKIELPKVPYESDEMNKFLDQICTERNIYCAKPRTTPRLLDKLIGELIEPLCINPTFLINHPYIMSPLAKRNRNNPQLTERFEMFINHREICNAYTELNDPIDQLHRFEDQMKDKAKGDLEAQEIDREYCRDLSYGMPPTAGWGCGIDRLVMFLTNQNDIREVIMFPFINFK